MDITQFAKEKAAGCRVLTQLTKVNEMMIPYISQKAGKEEAMGVSIVQCSFFYSWKKNNENKKECCLTFSLYYTL